MFARSDPEVWKVGGAPRRDPLPSDGEHSTGEGPSSKQHGESPPRAHVAPSALLPAKAIAGPRNHPPERLLVACDDSTSPRTARASAWTTRSKTLSAPRLYSAVKSAAPFSSRTPHPPLPSGSRSTPTKSAPTAAAAPRATRLGC